MRVNNTISGLVYIIIFITIFSIRESQAQVKHEWNVIELVSIEGVSLKKWNTKSYTTIVDSFLIISCKDDKILSLLSHPQQGFFDESDYRVYKRKGVVSSMKDTLSTIYRHEYVSPFYHNTLIIMIDEAIEFMMIHPNPQVGVVFHNKKK